MIVGLRGEGGFFKDSGFGLGLNKNKLKIQNLLHFCAALRPTDTVERSILTWKTWPLVLEDRGNYRRVVSSWCPKLRLYLAILGMATCFVFGTDLTSGGSCCRSFPKAMILRRNADDYSCYHFALDFLFFKFFITNTKLLAETKRPESRERNRPKFWLKNSQIATE